MSTQKRHLVELSEDDWIAAQRQAAAMGMSVRGYVRALINGGRVIPPAVREEHERIDAAPFAWGAHRNRRA